MVKQVYSSCRLMSLMWLVIILTGEFGGFKTHCTVRFHIYHVYPAKPTFIASQAMYLTSGVKDLVKSGSKWALICCTRSSCTARRAWPRS